MDSRHTVAVSFLLSLCGLVLIFMSVSLEEVRQTTIDGLSFYEQSDKVSVTGIVLKPRFVKQSLFFTLQDETASVDVVAFRSALTESSLYGIDIKNGDRVTVVGLPQLYKGRREIVAERLYLVTN